MIRLLISAYLSQFRQYWILIEASKIRKSGPLALSFCYGVALISDQIDIWSFNPGWINFWYFSTLISLNWIFSFSLIFWCQVYVLWPFENIATESQSHCRLLKNVKFEGRWEGFIIFRAKVNRGILLLARIVYGNH